MAVDEALAWLFDPVFEVACPNLWGKKNHSLLRGQGFTHHLRTKCENTPLFTGFRISAKNKLLGSSGRWIHDIANAKVLGF